MCSKRGTVFGSRALEGDPRFLRGCRRQATLLEEGVNLLLNGRIPGILRPARGASAEAPQITSIRM